jgi:hypothetical protein
MTDGPEETPAVHRQWQVVAFRASYFLVGATRVDADALDQGIRRSHHFAYSRI